MNLYIGIDDTDNLESKGTGHRARVLGTLLESEGLAKLICITRHQLLVHPDIPYTSHNSSACILVDADIEKKSEIIKFCGNFLLVDSAPGSDAGLCVAFENEMNDEIQNWGDNAKKIVLNISNAHDLAKQLNVFLQGYTGQKTGVIGSLAAVGLRYKGNDGRILWLPFLRELNSVFTGFELIEKLQIDTIETTTGETVGTENLIYTTDWVRPVMKNKKITLIVEEALNNEQYKWQHVSKEYIKGISN